MKKTFIVSILVLSFLGFTQIIFREVLDIFEASDVFLVVLILGVSLFLFFKLIFPSLNSSKKNISNRNKLLNSWD